MVERITFDWSEEWPRRDQLDGDKVLEIFPADKLDRQKYAEFLTQFLSDQGYDRASGEKRNYVLNLNSEWGSGKTYFLLRWAEDLKQYYPVVYVDAWKQDYSDDPLMTVISSMIKQLREQAGSAEDKKVIKASRKLFGLLKAAAPSAARSLTKRYLGIDPVAIMEAVDDDQLGDVKDENGAPIDMGLAASKVVEHLISEHDAKSAAIESLKEDIKQWVGAVIGKEKRSYPAFVFIDELDRCRPSYAVEMLETIKHIFDIPGVVFVVATDTEQLQHAVKAIYGEGFGARVYLGRFFNSRFSLKSPSLDNLLEVHCRTNLLNNDFFRERGITVWPNSPIPSVSIKNITMVLNVFGLSARSAIQTTERIIATLSNLERGKAVDLVMLATLLCLREKDEGLYDEIINGSFFRKKGDKAISLVDYLNRNYLFYDKGIERVVVETISPNKVTEKLYINNMNAQVNNYTDGNYTCSFEQYISDMFSDVFGLSNNKSNVAVWLGGDIGTRKIDRKTPEQQLQSELYNLWRGEAYQKDRRGGEIGAKWLQYTNYKAFEKQDVSPLFYKDLVELASAIDWIDGEDEA